MRLRILKLVLWKMQVYDHIPSNNHLVSFLYTSIFQYVSGCNWIAFSLSLNESIRLVNSFLIIDFGETSLAVVSLKYLLSLIVTTFNVLSFGFRILCTTFHISLQVLEDNFFLQKAAFVSLIFDFDFLRISLNFAQFFSVGEWYARKR